MQEVHLDKNVKLLDSPGIVFTAGDSDSASVLRNCVKVRPSGGACFPNRIGDQPRPQAQHMPLLLVLLQVEKLDDPVTPVAEILKRVPAKQLMLVYKIPAFQTPDQFLAHIAKSRGKLFKGGAPDMISAARVVLTDWNNGKIPYYTMPPKRGDGRYE